MYAVSGQRCRIAFLVSGNVCCRVAFLWKFQETFMSNCIFVVNQGNVYRPETSNHLLNGLKKAVAELRYLFLVTFVVSGTQKTEQGH